ncbi:MAG: 2-succinyl-5-enolpyruvyl-6-hydroxy-3-cyclohexene-1-carboxylic-acid synthase [Sandaracinaceae bacterium]
MSAEEPPARLLTAWADVLLGSLAEAGVRHAVISPGSRSTPFALAAHRCPDLRCHAVIDERAAAFLALGMGRASGRPALLLCTSGTAPAHYLPAVVEASADAVPVLVLSADRPPELQHAGAPQTIDQTRLYGDFARLSIDLGLPDPTPRALRGLRRRAAQAVARALGPRPGPVHLNAPARKPLEPVEAHDDAGRQLDARLRALAAEPAPTFRHAPAPAADVGLIAALFREAERPALVAGPLPPPAASLRKPVQTLHRLGVALFAEGTSQLRFAPRADGPLGDAFDHVLRDPGAPAPDVVLEIGRAPTSGAYAAWLEGRAGPTPPRHRVVLAATDEVDPTHRATDVLIGSVEATLTALAATLPGPVGRPGWSEALRRAELAVWDRVDRALEAEGWCEGAAVRTAVRSLPGDALLAVGNSLPVRHLDRFVRGGGVPLRVYSQRGANGIDGWLAQTAGALLATGGPGLLVLGDVAFHHDLTSLQLVRDVAAPFPILVLDNGGGRIFEQLPLAEAGLSEEAWALFRTPPRTSLAPLAEGFGVPYTAADDLSALSAALREALRTPGPSLVHARFATPPAALERRLRDLGA